MEKVEDMDNGMKWSAIPLTIGKLFAPKGISRKNLNHELFMRPVEGTHKFDGTNLGKDQDGQLYGRNKMVNPKAASYQKTPLEGLKNIDVAVVKKTIEELAAVEDLGNFVLYGELMCNKGLYDYTEKKLDSGWTIFGAMIQPPKDAEQIVDALHKAGFACALKGGVSSDGEGSEGAAEDNANFKIMLSMNVAFKELMDKFKYPTVPFTGRYENLYTLVKDTSDWLKQGMGEGIVITHAKAEENGKSSHLSKWKNGMEANSVNAGQLDALVLEIEADKDKEMFGENTEKALEMLNIMLDVQKSRLIMGKVPEPVKKGPKVKAPKEKKAGLRELSAEESAEYDAAIKSAKSKFDHEDTYFAKGMKGCQEFAGLIAKECLTDITPKDENEHNQIILARVKEDFIAFNRNKKK